MKVEIGGPSVRGFHWEIIRDDGVVVADGYSYSLTGTIADIREAREAYRASQAKNE